MSAVQITDHQGIEFLTAVSMKTIDRSKIEPSVRSRFDPALSANGRRRPGLVPHLARRLQSLHHAKMECHDRSDREKSGLEY